MFQTKLEFSLMATSDNIKARVSCIGKGNIKQIMSIQKCKP